MNYYEFQYFLQAPTYEQCQIFPTLVADDFEHFAILLEKHPEKVAHSTLVQPSHPLKAHFNPIIVDYLTKISQKLMGYNYHNQEYIVQNTLETIRPLIPEFVRILHEEDIWKTRSLMNDIQTLFYDEYHLGTGNTPSRYQKAVDLIDKYLHEKEEHIHFYEQFSVTELRHIHQYVSQQSIGAVLYNAWNNAGVFLPLTEILLGTPEQMYWEESIVDNEPTIHTLYTLGEHIFAALKMHVNNRFYPDPVPYMHHAHRLCLMTYFLVKWQDSTDLYHEHNSVLQRYTHGPLRLDGFLQWYSHEKLFQTLPNDRKELIATSLFKLPLDAWDIQLPQEHPHISREQLISPEEVSIAF